MSFKIKSREFKHKIIIQRYVLGKTTDGIPEYEWKELYSPRAKILNVRGSEKITALGQGVSLEKTFYIRYNHSQNCTNHDRIVYDGIPYNIVYINNVGENDEYLEIKGSQIDEYRD